MTLEDIRILKQCMHTTFDSTSGKEVMKFLERIGSWTPNVYDPMDTNSIVARDANRRLIGTLKTFLELTPEQIKTLQGG